MLKICVNVITANAAVLALAKPSGRCLVKKKIVKTSITAVIRIMNGITSILLTLPE